MNSVVLSILVITHNQLDLLKRCLKSVLEQELRVPFEVVVSDDRSTDGTEEWIEDLRFKIEDWKKEGKLQNLVELRYVHCNSDECDPKNVSERCGWNKLTVYTAARGKYFVNIDADDYLKSTDIYQKQLDMLESHPECSMCMQDVWQVKDGDFDTNGKRWPSYGNLTNGQVVSPEKVITDYRALNQCYMIRRHPEDDMRSLYGKHFDDTVITIHHLQYGPCVFLDRADYVWVQYGTSITKTLTGDDSLIEYGMLPFHHIKMIPAFKDVFMANGVHEWVHMFKVLSERSFQWHLTDRTLAGFREQEGYLYRVFCKEKLSAYDKVRLRTIRMVLLLYSKYELKKWGVLYRLMMGKEY